MIIFVPVPQTSPYRNEMQDKSPSYRSSPMQCALDVSIISEKLEVHPIISLWYFFSLSKKCNPPDIKFYLGKLTTKKFPIRCNVNSEPVFTTINITKSKENRSKIKITPYGEIFLLLNEIKFKI